MIPWLFNCLSYKSSVLPSCLSLRLDENVILRHENIQKTTCVFVNRKWIKTSPLCAHRIQFPKSQNDLTATGFWATGQTSACMENIFTSSNNMPSASVSRSWQEACTSLSTINGTGCRLNKNDVIIPLTLMLLVSLISLLMSDASPLSLDGSCCRMTPSPAQLYRL